MNLVRQLLVHRHVGLLIRRNQRRVDRVLNMLFDEGRHGLRERSRNVVRDIWTEQEALDLVRESLSHASRLTLNTQRRSKGERFTCFIESAIPRAICPLNAFLISVFAIASSAGKTDV